MGGGGSGVGVDWKVFVLAMLDEAANRPRPCKANLHVQPFFHYHHFILPNDHHLGAKGMDTR